MTVVTSGRIARWGEAVLPILATFGLAAIKVVSREQLADE